MNVVLLQERVAQADPTALLVPPRLLRRVIRADRQVATLRVPHRYLHLIDRDKLLAIASADELGLGPGRELPTQVLLLPLPDDLGRTPDEQILRRYSRLLFHGEAHRAFDRLKLDDAAVQQRVGRVGRAEFQEAHDVLKQEALLFDDADRGVYEEFATLYLELRTFEPGRLAAVFPSCLDRERVEAVFLADLDADAIASRTRLVGAAESPTVDHAPPFADEPDVPGGTLEAVAEEASRVGNLVRAAILQRRAGNASPHIEQLTARLLRALGMGEQDRADWQAGLTALLEPAARGYWNLEARLLYDLQKVCLDVEKPLFAADLVEWMVTLGRRPVKRPLPDLPLVLAVTHIRTAEKRLGKARIDEKTRKRLGELLQAAEHHLEARVRQTLRPKVAQGLDEAGLVAVNAAERLSRERLIEELLDRIVSIGALTLGDLRDAVARSRLKLGDLSGPGEFFAGDPLLKANENLARNLDGIARRGEFYLRWMQGFSSLFFGTAVGRMLTLYVLLPVLASFFLLKGADALISEVGHVSHWTEERWNGYCHVEEGGEKPPDPPTDFLFSWASFAGVAVFFLLLFHVGPFRRAIGQALYWGTWVPARTLIYDVPHAVITFGPLRAVLASYPFQLFMRFVGRPLLLTLPLVPIVGLLCYVFDLDPAWEALAVLFGGWFLATALILNTRWGQALEERATEGLGRAWELFHHDFLLGIWGFIVWVFRAIGDRLERWRYGVDERLRFRQGDPPSSFGWKLIVGVGWFAVVYLVRMIVILFVEPQVNPIKHFPVVTVSHKLTLLAADPVATATGLSFGTVLFTLGLVPGVFGFLAWELKENWRLYRANESPTIDPEMVGSHGEHVINYIRPGFHSGTLPRAFSRLRRARGAAAHRAEEELHHVDHELRHFVERELAAPLAPRGVEVAVGSIRLATNRVRVELECPSRGPAAWLEFENEDGQLAAGFVTPGWTAGLSGAEREAVENVLAAFFKRCGVDRLRTDEAFAGTPLRWPDWVRWCEARQGRLMPGVKVLAG